MKRLTTLVTLLGLLLVACAPAAPSAPTDAPAQPDTPTESAPEVESPTEASAPENPAPAAGTRNYEVTISGDAEAAIPPGSGQAQRYAEPDPRYELFFGDMDKSVFFILSDDITPGTYDLEVRDEMAPDQTATAEVMFAVVPGQLSRGAEDYNEEIDGTITLDEIGDTVSGSFEFTATYADTDDNDEEIRKTVTVTGSFSDLTVRDMEM